MLAEGVYILTLHLEKLVTLAVGRLGTFEFPQGYYMYIGSAMGGFAGRINRHLRRKKRMRWHIDYLLEEAELLWIDLYETTDNKDECALNRKVADLPGAREVCRGFGASDCKCHSHLHYFETRPGKRPAF